MNKYFTILIVLLIPLITSCTRKDDKAFETAKAQDTESSYNQYCQLHPDGKHEVEAKSLADLRAFEKAQSLNTIDAYRVYIEKYNDHAEEAKYQIRELVIDQVLAMYSDVKIFGEKREWEKAISILDNMNEEIKVLDNLNIEDNDTTTNIRKGIELLLDGYKGYIENPIEIWDEVIETIYHYKENPDRLHVDSVNVKCRLVNNTSKPVYNIIIKVMLYGKYTGIDPESSLDINSDGYFKIAETKYTACLNNRLQSGESKEFSFSKPISADLKIIDLDERLYLYEDEESSDEIQYDIVIESYKTAE